MSTASQPLVSVITPVYNGAEHLAECVESVLAQTYRNWDYTIVNNCSTDESLTVAQRFAASHSRIRIHNNAQFLRVIPNHNLALRQISPASKYCKMIFADDWMFPECLERMVAVAEEHPSLGMVGAYGLQGKNVVWVGLPYPSPVVPGHPLVRQRLLDPEIYVFGTPTSLLFRSDLIRSQDPFFNEANLHADTEKCLELLKKCDFGFVHQVLTFTRERPGSLSSFSKQMNTIIASLLHEVVTYGPDYLTEEEFKFTLNQRVREYYQFLALSLVKGRRGDKEFWNYHARKMTEAGVGFSRTRLARAFLAEFVNAALNPKATVEWLFARRADRLAARGKENASRGHLSRSEPRAQAGT
jgi:glycosyltransferase involved in cell wall biosynthesis